MTQGRHYSARVSWELALWISANWQSYPYMNVKGSKAPETRQFVENDDHENHQKSPLLTLCEGTRTVTDEFPTQKASNAGQRDSFTANDVTVTTWHSVCTCAVAKAIHLWLGDIMCVFPWEISLSTAYVPIRQNVTWKGRSRGLYQCMKT